MDLDEKVHMAQRGDDNAFYELIQQRKEILYKTAFTYVKNKEDALDIVHETVYKAYISIKRLKEPKFFSTWVMRILINCSLDYIKKNKKIITLNKDMEKKDCLENYNNEEILDLHKAVSKLEEKYKTIVILKYFQDLTLTEISEVLECPIGTVKTNLHKALKELRIDLREGEI